MADVPNKREFVRVDTKIPVNVYKNDELTVGGHLRDVSLKGVFLTGKADSLAMGDKVHVEICLEGFNVSLIKIKADGTVVRRVDDGTGIEFETLNFDGYEYLKNIVLYNAPDPDQAKSEIDGHVGLKRPSQDNA